MTDVKPRLAAALALLAAAATVVLPGAATPAAASEPCRTKVVGDPMPEGEDVYPLIDDLSLYQAWDLSMGAGITVAVVDSGVDARHPDLEGKVDEGSEFTRTYEAPGYVPSDPSGRDCAGHGTGIAGLIAARSPDDRMVGVAPDATIYPVRIGDEMGDVEQNPDTMLAAAIEDAVAAGARVINLSLASALDYEPVREAIEDAVAADVVVVAATGNEGNANATGGKMYPAAYDGVLGVGAVDRFGEPMEESNAGPWVDLVGIGKDVVLVAPGGEGYRVDSGNSYAAAQVSGAAALVRSLYPNLPAEEVIERLTHSATPLGGGRNDQTGWGLVDPFGALTYLDGAGDGDRQDDGAAGPGRVPVRPLPQDEPLLASNEATGLAVSGGLLLVVLLGLLAAPGVRRAARRGWRAGPASNAPPRQPANATGPPGASLTWLGGSGTASDQRNQTAYPHANPNSTRNRTR